MKICQKHWDRLRQAIEERGLAHLIAANGQDALRNIVTELEGRGAENIFDPLMACNNMIWTQGLKVLSLDAMRPAPDGSDTCPICECLQQYERWWIEGPADAALEEATSQGLI